MGGPREAPDGRLPHPRSAVHSLPGTDPAPVRVTGGRPGVRHSWPSAGAQGRRLTPRATIEGDRGEGVTKEEVAEWISQHYNDLRWIAADAEHGHDYEDALHNAIAG